VKVKNVGNNSTQILIGYKLFSQNIGFLDGKNYPYKGINKVLNIISAPTSSDKIIVDDYPEWSKNCFIAINANEDGSDIPSCTLLNGKIVEVKKIENGQAEITLDNPISSAISKGTKIRIHGMSGSYLYTNSKKLQPGEEETFSSSIKKDDNSKKYSSSSLATGTYYVVPILLSYSIGSNENTVLISDFSISY
jgi:hypothetical protein